MKQHRRQCSHTDAWEITNNQAASHPRKVDVYPFVCKGMIRIRLDFHNLGTLQGDHTMRRIIVTGGLLLWSMVIASAQPATLPFHTVSYSLNSGIHDGHGESERAVWREVIQLADAPWLRLQFGEANLGSQSYVQVTSLYDGSSQRLNGVGLTQWYSTSAFFNGDEVEVQLIVSPADFGVYIGIVEVFIGDPPGEGQGMESICGTTDDRTGSAAAAVGRLLSIGLGGGCTGWIVSNGLEVTAGHCVTSGSAHVLQFNVPSSLSDGTIQHPPASAQYSVNQQSILYQYTGAIGYDWAVFEVFDNSETGLQPIQAQGASFAVVQDITPSQLRVTGYGVDGPPPNFGAWPGPWNSDNQTQQTHVGSNTSSSGNIVRHTADTQGGNSGGPIIDEGTGKAIGVHTNAGCTSTGGNNHGTSTYNSNFWSALNPPVSVLS